jgi:catechol 2,3-dioxygenase-like lactoylglutathione lyase family enzyme
MQRFLELAIPTPDIQASLAFYETLGFTQARVGETWGHSYAVISDGRLLLGLHGGFFEDITPVFVHTGLRAWHRELEDSGLVAEQAQLDADSFNRVFLRDPDGGPVLLVEARTYSPPPGEPRRSGLGFFGDYILPTHDLAAARRFWDTLGLMEGWQGEAPHPWSRFTGSEISLGLHESATVLPGLAFYEADMDARVEALVRDGHPVRTPGRRPGLPHCRGMLEAPEGTVLYLCADAGWQD